MLALIPEKLFSSAVDYQNSVQKCNFLVPKKVSFFPWWKVSLWIRLGVSKTRRFCPSDYSEGVEQSFPPSDGRFAPCLPFSGLRPATEETHPPRLPQLICGSHKSAKAARFQASLSSPFGRGTMPAQPSIQSSRHPAWSSLHHGFMHGSSYGRELMDGEKLTLGNVIFNNMLSWFSFLTL